jgi:hypothetical protein
VVDHTAGADLAKVTVDLRQGTGPLKLRLLEKRSQGANAVDVELVMVEFGELQAWYPCSNERDGVLEPM